MAKKALCIGIDTYPTAPLGGCVADATEWNRLFSDFGFSTQLITNSQATRAGILNAIQSLLAGSSSGDVLALQFAGHGTHVPDISGDEPDGRDEAFCPYDFASGHLLIDDDVRSLLSGLPAGVSLTCFIDCCHSATITRSILGPTRDPAPGKARYVELSADEVAKYLQARSNLPRSGTRAIVPISGMREILFSACRANEVAYESNGRGAFSVAAQASLRRALSSGGATNGQLHQDIYANFGPGRRQNPELNCSPENVNRRVLAPETSGGGASGSSGGSTSTPGGGAPLPGVVPSHGMSDAEALLKIKQLLGL